MKKNCNQFETKRERKRDRERERETERERERERERDRKRHFLRGCSAQNRYMVGIQTSICLSIPENILNNDSFPVKLIGGHKEYSSARIIFYVPLLVLQGNYHY